MYIDKKLYSIRCTIYSRFQQRFADETGFLPDAFGDRLAQLSLVEGSLRRFTCLCFCSIPVRSGACEGLGANL